MLKSVWLFCPLHKTLYHIWHLICYLQLCSTCTSLIDTFFVSFVLIWGTEHLYGIAECHSCLPSNNHWAGSWQTISPACPGTSGWSYSPLGYQPLLQVLCHHANLPIVTSVQSPRPFMKNVEQNSIQYGPLRYNMGYWSLVGFCVSDHYLWTWPLTAILVHLVHTPTACFVSWETLLKSLVMSK